MDKAAASTRDVVVSQTNAKIKCLGTEVKAAESEKRAETPPKGVSTRPCFSFDGVAQMLLVRRTVDVARV